MIIFYTILEYIYINSILEYTILEYIYIEYIYSDIYIYMKECYNSEKYKNQNIPFFREDIQDPVELVRQEKIY